MTNYCSVSQARKLTGKSESTIKRMVREIVSSSDHPDRGSIKPNHEQVARLRASGERYTWSIAKELLLRRFPPPSSDKTVAETKSGQSPSTGQLVDILREQLSQKDAQIRTLEQQLDRKDEHFAILSERQRESNILMKALQERLSIEAPKPQAKKRRFWFSRGGTE